MNKKLWVEEVMKGKGGILDSSCRGRARHSFVRISCVVRRKNRFVRRKNRFDTITRGINFQDVRNSKIQFVFLQQHTRYTQ